MTLREPRVVEVSVREVAPHDFPAVRRVTAEVYIGEGYVPPTATARLSDIETRAAATTILVAIADESRLVGAVSLVRPGSVFAEIAREGEAEVRMLAVSPAERGGGIGQALMLGCIDLAREWRARRLVLSTQQSMADAQRLYGRLGMARAEGRDWVSAYGDTRLVYELPLL